MTVEELCAALVPFVPGGPSRPPTPGDRLGDDLHMDSLSMFEFVISLDERGFTISEDELHLHLTIEELHRLVAS